MKLWRITVNGLKGRKKDTRLLVLTVTLAYLFLTLSTTVFTSMEATREQQRRLLYGNWQVSVSGLTGGELDQLSEKHPGVRCRVLGSDEQLGTIGIYSEELAGLGNFRLLEGHFPEEGDEILVEKDALVSAGQELHAGDTIAVTFVRELAVGSAGRANNAELTAAAEKENERRVAEAEAMLRADPEMMGFLDAAMRGENVDYPEKYQDVPQLYHKPKPGAITVTMPSKVWPEGTTYLDKLRFWYDRDIDDSFWEDRYDNIILSFDEIAEEYGISERDPKKHFDELSEEDKRIYAEYKAISELAPRLVDLVSLDEEERSEELRVGDETVQLQYMGGEDLDTYDTVTMRIQREFTLAGVIEGCSELWDLETGQLPGLYVTDDQASMYGEAVDAVLGEFPYLEKETSQDLLFFCDPDRSPEEVYLSVMPDYNELLLARESCYQMQYTTADGYVNCGFLAEADGTGEIKRVTGSFTSGMDELSILEQSPVTGETKRVTINTADFLSGHFDYPFYHPPAPALATEEGTLEGSRGAFRINRYTYPIEESQSYLILLVVLALFATTVTAVLQIFATQIRKRMRRITLIRALGADQAQTARMLAYEFLFCLLIALPVGGTLGLGGAYGALRMLVRYEGMEQAFRFAVHPGLLLAGIAAGTLALFLGMAVPGLVALRAPLSGTMEGQARKKTHRRSRPGKETARAAARPRNRRAGRMTFPALIGRNLAVNRGRTLGFVLLSSLICSIALLCVCIGYGSFERYRSEVEWADKPDYTLSTPAAINSTSAVSLLGELEEVEGILRAEKINAGLNVPILFDGMEESPLVQEMQTACLGLQDETVEELFGETKDGELTLMTDVYSLPTTSPLLDRLLANADGELDLNAYKSGEEAILFVPLCRIRENAKGKLAEDRLLERLEKQDWMKTLLANAGRTTLSARDWMREVYPSQETIAVGDEVRLQYQTVEVVRDEAIRRTLETSVRIGAIVYAFEEEGLWPVTSHMRSFALIGSDALLTKAYVYSCVPYSYDMLHTYQQGTGKMYYDDMMGRTLVNVYTDPEADPEDVDRRIAGFAASHAMELTAYRAGKQKEYDAAWGGMAMAAFLGFAAVVIALLILDNTVASGLEADRRRMGILQSMGVTRGRFLQQQLYVGLLYAAVALTAAHAVWFLAACALTLAAGGGAVTDGASFFACFSGQAMWQYPWRIHAGICAVCAAFCIVLQVTPMFRLLRRKPMENLKNQ